MVEKPKVNPPSRYAIIGRYILPPDIFPLLEKTERGAGGEIQLTDALRELVRTGDFYGYVFEGTPLRRRREARLSEGHRRLRAAPSAARRASSAST